MSDDRDPSDDEREHNEPDEARGEPSAQPSDEPGNELSDELSGLDPSAFKVPDDLRGMEPPGQGGFQTGFRGSTSPAESGSMPSGMESGLAGGMPFELPDLQGMNPNDLGAMLEQVLGEAVSNPELAEVMRGMGVDPADPATRAAMRAQLDTFMSAQQSPTGARDLATEVARKHVSSTAGNDVHDAAAARAVQDAVAVATLWLDEHTTLASPAWRATGFSRAEWVEATMPQWFELIEPVSDGVTTATADALRKQVEELGPEAFGEALPAGLPEGFDPRAMVEQWAPMLGNLSRQMFSAQLGQAVGTLATEVVGGTEVGLPLTEPGLVALLPGNVALMADALEIDIAQVRLYLAVREAARVRLFAEVPWLGPQLLSAVSDYARNITIDTDAIESALSTIDATDPEALRTALQGNLFRPQPTKAQREALDRLETLLALAEGWVDHVTDRTTAPHLPQSAALGETIRRRRVGGAAQKTFAGLVGLELRPRRLRDAANLWAALESAGGAALRDGRWAHPDLAPTSADLGDVIGYVERATGSGSERAAGADAFGSAELGTDLDAVLQGILEDADRGDAADADPDDNNPGGTNPGGTNPRDTNPDDPNPGDINPDEADGADDGHR